MQVSYAILNGLIAVSVTLQLRLLTWRGERLQEEMDEDGEKGKTARMWVLELLPSFIVPVLLEPLGSAFSRLAVCMCGRGG